MLEQDIYQEAPQLLTQNPLLKFFKAKKGEALSFGVAVGLAGAALGGVKDASAQNYQIPDLTPEQYWALCIAERNYVRPIDGYCVDQYGIIVTGGALLTRAFYPPYPAYWQYRPQVPVYPYWNRR
jgi:hypothetical protein